MPEPRNEKGASLPRRAWHRTKAWGRWAASPAAKPARRMASGIASGTHALYKTYAGSSKWKWIAFMALLGVGTVAAAVLAYDAGVFGGGRRAVVEGRSVDVAEEPGGLMPQREVPYAWRDSAGALQVGRMEPVGPEALDVTLVVGDAGWPVVAFDVRDPHFPDWRPERDALHAEVHCPERLGPRAAARCDSVSVVVTPRPRSAFGLDFDPTVGALAELGLPEDGAGLPVGRQWWTVGAEPLRLWGLRLGGGLALARDTTVGLGAGGALGAGVRSDVVLTGSTQLVRNVRLQCSRLWGTGAYGCGASITPF